jgi:hypothetical protein
MVGINRAHYQIKINVFETWPDLSWFYLDAAWKIGFINKSQLFLGTLLQFRTLQEPGSVAK